MGFVLRCFQRLSPAQRGYPAMPQNETTGTPEVGPFRSSRTRKDAPQVPAPATDRVQPDSRRFEPSSRTSLIGEQPNPWEMLHPQDETSRHRGAKQRRLCGLLGAISLFTIFIRDNPLLLVA